MTKHCFSIVMLLSRYIIFSIIALPVLESSCLHAQSNERTSLYAAAAATELMHKKNMSGNPNKQDMYSCKAVLDAQELDHLAGESIFVVETQKVYRFVDSADTAIDDCNVLATAEGGSTRWVAEQSDMQQSQQVIPLNFDEKDFAVDATAFRSLNVTGSLVVSGTTQINTTGTATTTIGNNPSGGAVTIAASKGISIIGGSQGVDILGQAASYFRTSSGTLSLSGASTTQIGGTSPVYINNGFGNGNVTIGNTGSSTSVVLRGGNIISLNTAGGGTTNIGNAGGGPVRISAGEEFVLIGGASSSIITSDGSLNLSGASNISINAGNTVNINANNDSTTTIGNTSLGGPVNILSDNAITLNGSSINVNSAGGIGITGAGTANFRTTGILNVSGSVLNFTSTSSINLIGTGASTRGMVLNSPLGTYRFQAVGSPTAGFLKVQCGTVSLADNAAGSTFVGFPFATGPTGFSTTPCITVTANSTGAALFANFTGASNTGFFGRTFFHDGSLTGSAFNWIAIGN